METAAQPTTVKAPQDKKIFYLVVGFFVIAIVILVGIIVLLLTRNNQPTENTNSTTSSSKVSSTVSSTVSPDTVVMWSFDGEEWKSMGSAPSCDNPLVLKPPVDVNLATNILYPGQFRGGDYKAHGGFRFDNATSNEIEVSLPLDAYLWRGSRYIEAGEVQYLLDFVNPCGITFRFDHLLTLSDEFAQLVDELPAAEADNSRTTNFSNPKIYQQGELIATEVGFKNSQNVSVDWGVYDLRNPNSISGDLAWSSIHENKKETAFFGVCWLDLLPTEEETIVKNLPGAGTEGTTSDYCQ